MLGGTNVMKKYQLVSWKKKRNIPRVKWHYKMTFGPFHAAMWLQKGVYMWMELESEGIDSLLMMLLESATWRRWRKRECGLNHDSTLYENLHYLKWMAVDFVNTLINRDFQLAFLIKVWKKVWFKPSSAKFSKFLRYARPWTELWFRTELWQPYLYMPCKVMAHKNKYMTGRAGWQKQAQMTTDALFGPRWVFF